MSLTEKHKAQFQWLTNALLIVALGTMAVALVLQIFPATKGPGNLLVTIGVISVIVSTPLRLLMLAIIYHTQGERRPAFSALLLVLALGAGALVKILFL